MSADDEQSDALKSAFEALERAGAVPPSASFDYLVEWEGEEATRGLLELLEEGGQPAIHAVRILGERADEAAVEPMIRLLVEEDLDKLMRDEITFAFHKYGASAVDPLLDAYERAHADDDPEAMLAILEAALETGAAHTRMSRVLAIHVEHHPAIVRRMLPDYEATDEVIELLEERAAAIPELEADERPDGEAIQAIWNTIEQLGGDVPEPLRREMRPGPPDRTDSDASAAEAYIKGGSD